MKKPKTATDELIIISPEEFRRDMPEYCETISQGLAPALVGMSEADAPYLITPVKLVDESILDQYCMVSTGQLKKDFPTARSLVWNCNLGFLVTNKKRPLVTLTRNPACLNPAIPRLLSQSRKHRSFIENLDPNADQTTSGTKASENDLKTFLTKHFEDIEIVQHKWGARILTAIDNPKK